jgi:pyrroline-5-carboxylate reductase
MSDTRTPTDTKALRLAVLGTGKMASALVRGWLATGSLLPDHIRLYNRTTERALTWADEWQTRVAETPAGAVWDADVVLVSVKPWAVAEVLEAAHGALPANALIVSVAAGVRINALEQAVGEGVPVVRVMPNTPALVGAGASAFCRGTHATNEHAEIAGSLFRAVGSVVEVTEDQIDAVIGVSGSGVAYLYLVIEALTDGGVRAGLGRDVARTLAAQTALGAAMMVLETGEHPAVLKDAVTTPGGTTIAALQVLEEAGLRGTLMKAVLAARDRARELG